MTKNSEPILYIKLFLIVVLCAALISLLYKAILLVKKSTFVHDSFNLLLIDRDAHIVHIDTVNKKISIVKLPGARVTLLGHSLAEQSAVLGILVDGSITFSTDHLFPLSQFMSLGSAYDLVFSKDKYKFENVNDFDILKILFWSKFISKEGRGTVTVVSRGQEVSNDLNRFTDVGILSEQLSIQVVNATDIDGFGKSLSNALKTVGYNVVALGNARAQPSIIRASLASSESISRMSMSLKIPVKESNSQDISDVTLILGPDILSK